MRTPLEKSHFSTLMGYPPKQAATFPSICIFGLFSKLNSFIHSIALYFMFFIALRYLIFISRVHATLQPTLVGRLVGWSRFTFFYDFISLTSQLLPK